MSRGWIQVGNIWSKDNTRNKEEIFFRSVWIIAMLLLPCVLPLLLYHSKIFVESDIDIKQRRKFSCKLVYVTTTTTTPLKPFHIQTYIVKKYACAIGNQSPLSSLYHFEYIVSTRNSIKIHLQPRTCTIGCFLCTHTQRSNESSKLK